MQTWVLGIRYQQCSKSDPPLQSIHALTPHTHILAVFLAFARGEQPYTLSTSVLVFFFDCPHSTDPPPFPFLLRVQDVSVPLLCMTALDDPLIPRHVPNIALEASRSNPHVISLSTERGGHLGWLTGWRGESWGMAVVMHFISTVIEQAGPVIPSCEA